MWWGQCGKKEDRQQGGKIHKTTHKSVFLVWPGDLGAKMEKEGYLEKQVKNITFGSSSNIQQ